MRTPAQADSQELRISLRARMSARDYIKGPLCLLLCVCLAVAWGCVNLNDVAQLTQLANAAKQTLPPVVADIAASCERQNILFRDTPADERPPGLHPLDCSAYEKLAGHITKDQSVLIAYFDALGKLAANKPLSYAQTIDTNVNAISGMTSLSSDAKSANNAAQDLAKVLGDAVTSSFRGHKVNSLIERTNPAVQQLASDLGKVIGQDYLGILDNEGNELNTYYQSPIAADGQSERLTLILVERQYEGDLAALHARKAAAAAYQKVMANLAAFHGKLYAEAERRASLHEIAQQIGPYLSDVKASITQLQTLRK